MSEIIRARRIIGTNGYFSQLVINGITGPTGASLVFGPTGPTGSGGDGSQTGEGTATSHFPGPWPTTPPGVTSGVPFAIYESGVYLFEVNATSRYFS